MKYKQLGKTDINVSILALGCWAFAGGGTWGEQDDNASIKTVHAALDLGITFFDTAPAYGNGKSEEVLGKALKGRRTQAIIADKISRADLSKDALIASCENSLKLLQTDHIDLLQIHWPHPDIPVEETVSALYKLKQDGKVRTIGVCNHGLLDMDDYLNAEGEMLTNQLPYSLLWRGIEFEILPKCQEKNIGILPYSPLMQGLLTGKYRSPDEVPEGRARTRHFSKERRGSRHEEEGCEELTFTTIAKIRELCQEINQSMAQVALAWLYHQSLVISVLAGARNPEQVQTNAASVSENLNDEIIQHLTEETDELKRVLGPNPDMWAKESRFR